MVDFIYSVYIKENVNFNGWIFIEKVYYLKTRFIDSFVILNDAYAIVIKLVTPSMTHYSEYEFGNSE